MSLDKLLRENGAAKEYFDTLSPQIQDILRRQGEEIDTHGALLESAGELARVGTGKFPLDAELAVEWVKLHQT